MERQLPPALTLRRRKPQPHQMPPGCRWRVVLVVSAGVEYVLVGEELDVAHFKDHMQGLLETRLLKYVGGLELGGRKRRDLAFVAEAGQGAYEIRIPSGRFVSWRFTRITSVATDLE